MILPDINLLVYAYAQQAPQHASSRRWWESLLNGSRPVVIPWAVTCGYLRLMTSPAVLAPPLPPGAASEHVRAWFERPVVEVIEPGPRHLNILARLLDSAGTAGSLTSDAHLAAIAIEHQCELHSSDTDFARFPGLRWTNPLA